MCAPPKPRPTCLRYNSSPAWSWEHLFQNRQPLVHLVTGDTERRADPKRIPSARQEQQTTLERLQHDGVALVLRPFLRPAVAHHFNPDHQAAAANVADHP